MHLLLIAPYFPPANTAEAIQADRFLKALDRSVRVTLVTTAAKDWQNPDQGFPAPDRPGMKTITLRLPFGVIRRLAFNRRLAALHVPDPFFWLPWFSAYVAAQLDDLPDVIYSRSTPLSSALLGRRLKQRLGRPWMMYLSDPWTADPYRQLSPRQAARDRALEAACFTAADRISFSSEGQAAHYRACYPDRAAAIGVAPVMMPPPVAAAAEPRREGPLRLVHTGIFFSLRNPSTLLEAMELLRERAPREAAHIQVDFYGRMTPDIAARIDATPGCRQHGVVSPQVAARVQAQSDILVTIDPAGTDPMLLHFMPSKNMDYLACGKPILALTQDGSETARLCAAGYGWALGPQDREGVAEKLSSLVRDHMAGRPLPPLPELKGLPFDAVSVTAAVVEELRRLAAR